MTTDLMVFCIDVVFKLAIIYAIAKQQEAVAHYQSRMSDWSKYIYDGLEKRTLAFKYELRRRIKDEIAKSFGSVEKATRKAAIAEKFAERAFTVANAASLGVIALQKSLAVPRIMTKVQAQKNQLAKSNIDKLFTTEGQFDFLRSELSDEDNELLDKIEEHNAKQNGI